MVSWVKEKPGKDGIMGLSPNRGGAVGVMGLSPSRGDGVEHCMSKEVMQSKQLHHYITYK